MVAFPHDCPHCATQRASFEVVAEYRPPAFADHIHAFVRCGVCGQAAVAVFLPLGQQVDQKAFNLVHHLPGHPDDVRLDAFFPPPATPEAPDHLPPNVGAYFLEAAANVKTGPNAAGAMLRKSIDVALKHVAPEAKGNLIGRIDKAAKLGKITPELADWAHHVRLEGNDAAHDEDPFTREQAEHLFKFTKLLLMYLFTLPGMLAEYRGDSIGEAEDAAPPPPEA